MCACLCVCVCVRARARVSVFPYNTFVYHVSAQGVDERMINVHYYYYYYYFDSPVNQIHQGEEQEQSRSQRRLRRIDQYLLCVVFMIISWLLLTSSVCDEQELQATTVEK